MINSKFLNNLRTATARGKAEQADYAAVCAREDSSEARGCAQNFDPNFHQPGQPETFRDVDTKQSVKMSAHCVCHIVQHSLFISILDGETPGKGINQKVLFPINP